MKTLALEPGMIGMSRRGLIGAGLAASASGLAAHAMAASPKAPFFRGHGLPVGLQLYTLGADLAKDLDGMLGQVARIGYRTVETAGYAGRTPQEMRAALDKAGLKCTSAHIPAAAASSQPSWANIDQVIADAKVLGFSHVVLPMFGVPARITSAHVEGESTADSRERMVRSLTVDDWKGTADLLNSKGKALKAAGLTAGYHNHNVEFAPVGGTTGLEILLKGTDPGLVSFEMDVGWVVAGGHDPFALLKAHACRFKQMHVKDVKATTKTNFAFRQDPTEVGSGIIDWKKLLPAAYAEGVRGFFVEQEPPFEHPRIESAKICFDYLNAVVA